MLPIITKISEIDGLVQDCSNSSALAMELLQSSSKPSKWYFKPIVIFHKSQ